MNGSPLRLIFETHATSVDNEAAVASGWADARLSAVGETQARELGARRSDDDLAAVFCSDLERAWRTAEIAFGPRGVPIVRDARLRECDYGTLTRQPAPGHRGAARVGGSRRPFPVAAKATSKRRAAWRSGSTRCGRDFAGQTIVVVGHRATFYAFQHLLASVPLADATRRPVAVAAGVDLRR